ncbi:MAG: hypothetical protein BJ554DRAFT_6376 [Olpidium bornovanus]|uniref:EF-hand domain-containing protein n=1 Tax=Olpidium bornovanus TaxID=278681 RepID=A0A8H8A270_9FUNG|nr:MAG: hypothetical protein BJ554DRAFT_6376 [Olpidium bornovanus]
MERHNIDPALSSQSCAATGEAAGHRKAYVSAGLKPRDFAEILEGVVWNHPGMRFLSDNPLFQERYEKKNKPNRIFPTAETVIVRLFYESNRSCSRSISREEFRRSRFPEQLRSIERWTDMNSNGTVFSYKHFYVIYCKFWEIDQDHDMLISERDLAAYGSGCLQSRAIRRISRGFGKRSDLEPPAAARRRRAEAAAATLARGGAWDPSPAPPAPPDDENGLCRSGSVDSVCSAGAAAPPADAFSFSGASSPRSSSSASFGVEKWDAAPALTYRDFIWFLLSDVDKSTPTAVEYWFRVMDTDSDGVISLYELETWWSGQAARFATIAYDGPTWTDALCQMMDCVRPKNPDFITLSDLKRSGQAAVFVEYFLHVQKHIQNEQRYQQEIRHLHRLRASERLGRPPPPVAGGPGAWSGGEDGGGGGEPVRRLADVPPDEDGRSDWDWYADDQYEYLIYEEQQQQHQQQQQQQLDNGRRRRRKFANGLSWSSSSSSSSDDDEVDDDDDDLGGGGGGIGGGGIGIGIGGETISVSEEEEEEEEDEDDDEKDEDGKGGSP